MAKLAVKGEKIYAMMGGAISGSEDPVELVASIVESLCEDMDADDVQIFLEEVIDQLQEVLDVQRNEADDEEDVDEPIEDP